ncbi:MAG: hypothetical protein ACO1NU_11470 [Arcticibacter sp.]
MIKFNYRSALLVLILCSLADHLHAQQSYKNFSIGIGGGLVHSYTDRQKPDLNYLASGSLDYYFTPYLNAGLELQGGTMSGSSINADNGRTEGFNSEFATFQVRGKVHLGEFTGRPRRYRVFQDSFISRVAKGLYLGSGGGVLVIRSRENSEALYHNKELYLPAMAGIDVSMGDDSRILLNLNYQLNFVLGDKIDGLVSRGSKNDMFSSLTLGVAYTFGRLHYL